MWASGKHVVLKLIEVVDTLCFSFRSRVLVAEPFLGGLIASTRRIVVGALEAASLSHGGASSTESPRIFRASMIAFGLLGVLVLVLVFSIILLRRRPPAPDGIEGI
jgi:hypothetical protein